MYCVLEFNQSQWLKPYVKFNTEKRIDVEKDGKALYKFMKNAVYGKTMEKLRNRIDVKLVSNKKRLFTMDIQSKLYVTWNNWQRFSCNTQKQSYINA